MVFQNYALFPHMTVAREHRVSPRDAEGGRAERARRVAEALSLVDLPGSADDCRANLGRTAAARGTRPCSRVRTKLFLLDEPFGALDRKLREQMQLEVRRLQRRLGVTALFVTHDQEEALILTDRIAVMEPGRIVQLGSPRKSIVAPPIGSSPSSSASPTSFA